MTLWKSILCIKSQETLDLCPSVLDKVVFKVSLIYLFFPLWRCISVFEAWLLNCIFRPWRLELSPEEEVVASMHIDIIRCECNPSLSLSIYVCVFVYVYIILVIISVLRPLELLLPFHTRQVNFPIRICHTLCCLCCGNCSI